jgi:hypothetical protein
MQRQLPFFLGETKLINHSLGYFEKEAFVYYLHNGNPIYCHSMSDKNSYRFILGNLVTNRLCTITELHESLGEPRKNIERYAKTFREKGAGHFFGRKETRGQCYKMTNELMVDIQSLLDAGWSYYRISHHRDISEAAIRYHIKNGNLKKKAQQPLKVAIP